MSGGAAEIEPGGKHRVGPRAGGLGVFRVDRSPKKIGGRGHFPIIRIPVTVGRGAEKAGDGSMARDGMGGIGSPDCFHAGFQVARQLVVNESSPIEVVRVGKDGREPRRCYLLPVLKIPVPGSI